MLFRSWKFIAAPPGETRRLRKNDAASGWRGDGAWPEYFDERSDVDLAVSGVADSEFLRAVAAVTGIDNDISVDLIQIEQAPESLRRELENGVAV